MKKILLPLLLFSLARAEQIRIVRSGAPFSPEQRRVYEHLLKAQARTKSEVSHRALARIRTNALRNQLTTLKVLALRVEFVEDSDTLTTGNGKMDLKGFLRPRDGLFYDPPHTKTYFERQLQFLRNYYWSNSRGRLDIEATVMPPGELASYQLPRDMLSYGHPIYTFEDFTEMETGLCRLMRDAIRAADSEVDFSQYDQIIIFHAGSMNQSDIKNNSPYDLWAGTLGPGALATYLGDSSIVADNGRTLITDAVILPEMARQDTNWSGEVSTIGMIGLAGTLVHEFGHLLGLPDLYDVTGYGMGVGGFDIMGNGGWLGDPASGAPLGSVPGMMSAWGKTYLGWLAPRVVVAPESSISIYATEMDTLLFPLRDSLNQTTIVKIPITPTEYFLVENRQADVRRKDTLIIDVKDGVPIYVEDGEYDFFMPGSGILIWHIDQQLIDDNIATNTVNIGDPSILPHKGIDLEEADGIQDFDRWVEGSNYELDGSVRDPFYLGNNTRFGPATNPPSDGYHGRSDYTVEITSPPDTVMTIAVKNGMFEAGFPRGVGRAVGFTAPAWGDLDRDGTNEIVAAARDGYLYAWHPDGTPYTADPAGTAAILFDSTRSSVALGDLTGSGRLAVVVGCDDRKIYAFSADTANRRLKPLPGFPVSTADRVRASPMLVDLDLDGKREIVVGSTDGYLYALDDSGKALPGFPVNLNSEIRSAAALVPGASGSPPRIAVLGSDNRLFLLNRDGTLVDNFPVVLGKSPLYAPGSPAVGDIDRDGAPEICVIAAAADGYRFFALNDSGRVKYQSNRGLAGPAVTSPALADLNGDGFLETVAAVRNRVYAFNYNGTVVDNFPIREDSTFISYYIFSIGGLLYIAPFITDFIFHGAPIVANGLAGASGAAIVLGSPASGLLGYGSGPSTASPFPLATGSGVTSPGLAGDFDADGILELACGTDSGYFYVWQTPAPASGAALPWSAFLRDAAHTGCYPDSALPPRPQPSHEMVRNFYVYPNPCETKARARFYLGDVDRVTLSLLDLSGKLIEDYAVDHPLPDVYNEVEMDFGGVASGVYAIRLAAKKGGNEKVLFFKLAVIR